MAILCHVPCSHFRVLAPRILPQFRDTVDVLRSLCRLFLSNPDPADVLYYEVHWRGLVALQVYLSLGMVCTCQPWLSCSPESLRGMLQADVPRQALEIMWADDFANRSISNELVRTASFFPVSCRRCWCCLLIAFDATQIFELVKSCCAVLP